MSEVRAIVLLHGNWYGPWCWEGVKENIKKNIGNIEIITPEFPNYKKNESASEINLNDYVRIVEKVVAGFPNKSVILVGHSMSGLVITEFAYKFPEKINSLVYISAFLLENGDSIWEYIKRRKNNRFGAKTSILPIYGRNGYSFDALKIDKETVIPRFCNDFPNVDLSKFNDFVPLTPIKQKFNIGREFKYLNKHYILCKKDIAIPFVEQQQMVNKFEIPNSIEIEASHSPFFSKPDEITKYLIDIIRN